MLQRLGLEWRPDTYWANRIVERAVMARDAGFWALLAGCRRRPEYDAAVAVGATLVRLDVSEAEQDRRAIARDGRPMSAEARRHPTETELDDADFDLRIDTDHIGPDRSVELVLELVAAKLETRSGAAA